MSAAAVQSALFAGSGSRVLVVDDDEDVRKPLVRAIKGWGLKVAEAENLSAAKTLLQRGGFGIIFMDKVLEDGNGYDYARELVDDGCDFDIVVMTGAGTSEEALNIGGRLVGYLPKPFEYSKVKEFLWALLASSADDVQPSTVFVPEGAGKAQSREVLMVGNNRRMIELATEIATVARMATSVLITGETGVGKEVMARKIHNLSNRSGQKFVGVNCGALTESLLESELFGYEKGGFTGAAKVL